MNIIEKPQIIFIEESLLESLLKDLVSFGLLLLCIWASWKSDNLFWQFVLGAIGFLWIVQRIQIATDTGNVKKFYSLNKAYYWLSTKIKTEAA